MRTVQKKVFYFDELSEKAQAKAIENYREGLDFPWLTDDMVNYLEELLAAEKITYDFTPNVYYSLSYSQGDGAMFEGTLYWKGYIFSVKQYGHYYHENSKTIEIERRNGQNITDATWKKMFDQFEPLYVEICKKLAKYGYDEIESQTSDESITMYLQEEFNEFYEDGSTYYGE